MSANVSYMFSGHNEVPWHRTNCTCIEGTATSEEALHLAHLDYDVVQEAVFTAEGTPVERYRFNRKSDDGTILGIVTDRYQVIQNTEAFAFTDGLIGKGCRYETAGALDNWRTVWLLACLEPKNIMGDTFNNYLVFKNSHDGKGAVKVCVTPVRVVCQNTLNCALLTAKRTFSMKHVGDIGKKLHQADEVLELSQKYLTAVEKSYYDLQKIKLTEYKVQQLINQLFPLPEGEDVSRRTIENVQAQRIQMAGCYEAPDLANFKGTGYGFINAVSDWAGHATPLRETSGYYGNLFDKVTNGHPVLDKAYELVTAL